MQKSNAPLQFVLPFAGDESSAYRNVIPIPSQSGVTPGAASFTDGFPPVTMESIASGGVPPYGPDMNGILYDATLAAQWQQAGYVYPYNSAFATNANVGGYPAGALLGAASGACLWFNTADNNTTSPDTSSGANWLSLLLNAGSVPVSATGGSTTLTANQLKAELIQVTGALTSNATLVLPLVKGAQYIVQNGTTGAYTLTVQSTTGAGVVIPQGANIPQGVLCDGTNWYSEGLSGGPYLPLTGTAVAATELAAARAFSITGLATAAAINFDGTGEVQLNVTALNVPAALGYTPANDASVVHIAGTETITGAKTFEPTVVNSHVPTGQNVTDTPGNFANAPRLNDSFVSGCGGTLMFGVNARNFAFIRGYFTNGGGNGIGKLCFGVRPSVTSSTINQVLVLNEDASATFIGGITCATMNASSSDRRLKRDIKKREPRPLHRSVPFVSYVLKENGWQGLGSVAQTMQKTAPEHVGEFEWQPGKKRLSLNYAGAAYEQAFWAGAELDRQAKLIAQLTKRLAKLERRA